MSFFYPNESKFIEGKIDFNYPEKSINKRDISEKLNYQQTMRKPNQYVEIEGELIDIKDKYYEIQYTDREFQFQDLKMKSGNFHTKKMYVYGLLHHNISQYSNKNIVGEIVIEHENLSPRKSNVYTCFLLQNNETNVENSMDKLLQLIKNKDKNTSTFEEKVVLNDDIPQQKEVIYYESNNPGRKKHIYIFLEPISVNQDSADFLNTLTYKTQLFETNAPMDKKFFSVDFTPKTSKEGFASMFSSVREGYDGYYLDCKPAGESEATTPGYVAPISSEFTKSKGTVDGLTILVDLLLFFILVITVFFCAPSLYKYLLINPIVNSFGSSNPDIYRAIAGLDMWVLLLNVFVFILFLIGAAYKMNSFFIFGISWLLITFFSVLTIMISKGKKPFWSFNNIEIEPPVNDEHNASNLLAVIANLLSDGDLIKEADNIMGVPPFWFSILICLVILFIIITPVSITQNLTGAQIAIATFLGIAFSFLIATPVRTIFTKGATESK
jgi:hypothetical protein